LIKEGEVIWVVIVLRGEMVVEDVEVVGIMNWVLDFCVGVEGKLVNH
jgi:hypothetical protein